MSVLKERPLGMGTMDNDSVAVGYMDVGVDLGAHMWDPRLKIVRVWLAQYDSTTKRVKRYSTIILSTLLFYWGFISMGSWK